ncbi:MAG: NAD(P)-dependent alcohol dehydrogenase [Candidatus Zixiibacteriota bacterium]|nr:MAG: NAD(P)-dependent alcohol dehydrogenase [candidate division Zixibacteria bacterium]
MQINCQAAMTEKARLEAFSYEPSELGPFDIDVEITHCGICHSDLHLVNNDWGISTYPLVPGHEIIGTVTAAGPMVTHLAVGQRVGIGWQRSACLQCETCLAGEENLCAKSEATCVGHYGGFATAIRTDSRFAFAIPEALDSENAAPLLCAGVTVFTPLKHFNVRPMMRVGVIGIGGLGHLAVQFARAFGCEVTAFSSSPDKEAEAKALGAHHFLSSRDQQALEAAAGSLDFILSTVNVDLDWTTYLNILRPNGKLCQLGLPPSPLTVPILPLLFGRKSVCSSPIGGRRDMIDMLEFAARHNIVAKTELMPLGQVNDALARLAENKARYRIVLKVS